MAEAQLTNQLTRIDSMTNVELRAELKRRGRPTSGNKKDLLAKLRAALQQEYEQAALEAPAVNESLNLDGRGNHHAALQQSPVVPFDVTRTMMNNSLTPSTNYMTPHGGSPMGYPQQMHSADVPLTYNNLQMHDQTAVQYPPVYNLTMHQSPAPMIPVPQQLTISPSERQQIYHQSLLLSPQQQQQQPMNTRRGRPSVDAPFNASISPPVMATPSPEKKPRAARSKKPSVDSQSHDVEPQQTLAMVENSINQMLDNSTTNEPPPPPPVPSVVVNTDNNLEVNAFVSKSIDDEEKELEKELEETARAGESRSPSVGSSSAKSESVIKEIPLSGERHRLSRSKSPKSRWHHSPSPQEDPSQIPPVATVEGEHPSAPAATNGDEKTPHEQTEIPSANAEAKPQETNNKESNGSADEQQSAEKAAPQQQLKPSRSQTSSSSSLMKGLNRSTTSSNRMNLSSDVLKTLIPDISLAPESDFDNELDSSAMEQSNGDHSVNEPMLETSAGSGFLLTDSATIGDVADQKQQQQRHRTVVIDLAVDSSSLNDDLVGNSNGDVRKKTPTSAAPARIASFESKALFDGKTNATMMDEPVRVKDATATREPASRIVYIRGLTRPFTLPQLKELVGRYGSFADGEFWLDKIKSQCLVMYASLEEAQNAREGLDGCRWPSTNPKTLIVRFGRQEEFDFSKSNDLPPDQMSSETNDSTNNRTVQEKQVTSNRTAIASRRSASPTDESKGGTKKVRPTGNADVREWDIPKLHQDKESISDQREVIEESTAKSNDPPAKGLDDYFRKTAAKPAIYWLQLTEEQIAERIRRQEQRKAERDEEQRKRQLEESARAANATKDSKSRSHRRSPSPREKRKRVTSSPSSPARRDNKRH